MTEKRNGKPEPERGATGSVPALESALSALKAMGDTRREERERALSNFAKQAALSLKGHKARDLKRQLQEGSVPARPKYEMEEWNRLQKEQEDLEKQIKDKKIKIESDEGIYSSALAEFGLHFTESDERVTAAKAEIESEKEVLEEMNNKLTGLKGKVRIVLNERQRKTKEEQEAVSKDYRKFVIDELLKIVENPQAFTKGGANAAEDEVKLDAAIGPDLAKLIKDQSILVKGIPRRDLERALEEELEKLQDKDSWDDETEFVKNVQIEFGRLQQELLELLAKKEAFINRQTPEAKQVFERWDANAAEARKLRKKRFFINAKKRKEEAHTKASRLVDEIKSGLDNLINSLTEISNRMMDLLADATIDGRGGKFLYNPRNIYTQKSLEWVSGYHDNSKRKAMEEIKAKLFQEMKVAKDILQKKIIAIYLEVAKYKNEKGLS